ncbi:uncharacterized protein LOC108863933 [Galendromus occidentalis]|uniref:Uncharacterized protein LOC108863933 n=1 Tax=Galendromus occidentalis TaxID=34638 RepID=A0AAJ7P9R5_9ACAR|nr:uncharacterized protein LOC108863933 [Galendromus occidentalis]
MTSTFAVLLRAALLIFAVVPHVRSYPRNSEVSGWTQAPPYLRWNNARQNNEWLGSHQSVEDGSHGWIEGIQNNDHAGYQQTHQQEARKPYHFSYSAHGHDGGSAREEKSDENGRVTGWYTIVTADGHKRKVSYVADEHGFRAKVETNEPGTANEDPASVRVKSDAPKIVHNEPNFDNRGGGWQQQAGWSSNPNPVENIQWRGAIQNQGWTDRSEPAIVWNSQRNVRTGSYRQPSPPPVKTSWNQAPINNDWYPSRW